MNPRISIRTKFLFVMSLLLTACVAIYLFIAVQVFRNDKTELIYDLNRSTVANLSVEMESLIGHVGNQFKLYALLAGESLRKNSNKFNTEIFSTDGDVVFASLYRQKSLEKFNAYFNDAYLETYGLKKEFFDSELPEEKAIPFEKIFQDNEAVWNATGSSGIPLIGYGRSVLIEDSRGVAVDRLAVIGYIKPDRILKSLQSQKTNEAWVMTADGETLLHSDPKKSGISLKASELFKTATDVKTKTGVLGFSTEEGEFLGAFSKAHRNEIFILAQSPESKAFSAIRDLIERSIIFGLMLITASFLAAILFSRTLTGPIFTLVDGMNQVATGDLTTQIKLQSNDEIQVLANSFNKMITDLKQSRDELEEMNRELDQKVKERTAQLDERNQAVKEAQEALIRTARLASVGEIAGKAAHEVLNPLTAMITRLTLMDKRLKVELEPQFKMITDIQNAWGDDYKNGGFDLLVSNWRKDSQITASQNLWQEDQENIRLMKQGLEEQFAQITSDLKFLISESERISKIVNGMRKLSHIRSDHKENSIHMVLKEIMNIMGDSFSKYDIQTYLDFKASDDAVMMDRDEFIQAVTNLMRNSIHAICLARPEKRSGEFWVETSGDDQKIYIDLIDNGCGISKENQHKLFDKNFTTKSSDEGTGLGMGISRRFIRSFGGDIDFISSEENKRTVFRITMPLKKASSLAKQDGAA